MRKQVDALARDLNFMRNPSSWPNWPLLPVKLRSGDMLNDRFAGLLLANGRPVVYFGNLFRLPKGNTVREALNQLEQQAYVSFEALASDYTVD